MDTRPPQNKRKRETQESTQAFSFFTQQYSPSSKRICFQIADNTDTSCWEKIVKDTNGEIKKIPQQTLANADGKLQQTQFFFSNHSSPSDWNLSIHNYSKKLSIALATIAGKINRLIMGKLYSRLYFAEKFFPSHNEDQNGYRFSSAVMGVNSPPDGAKVYGTVMSLVLELFNMDDDHHYTNLLYVKNGEDYCEVRIDTEWFYAANCFPLDLEAIRQHLNYLYKPNIMPDVNQDSEIDEDENEDEIEELPTLFNTTLIECDANTNPFFLDTFKNEIARREELFVALCLILRHDVTMYFEIIDKVISDNDEIEMDYQPKTSTRSHAFYEFCMKHHINYQPRNGKEFKDMIKHILSLYYDFFKTVAFELPGFKNYFDNKEFLNTPCYKMFFPQIENIEIEKHSNSSRFCK